MQTAFTKFSFASAHSDQPFLLGDLLYSSHADNKVEKTALMVKNVEYT